MLKIKQFTFNPFQENTYIIFNEINDCWIIDPGMSNAAEEKELYDFILQNKFIPQAIINTHAHIDHIMGVDYLASKFNIPFYLHEKELPILNNAKNTARMFGFDYEGVKTKPTFFSEQDGFAAGHDFLEIRYVPGHSPGSVAFYFATDEWVISGDALFAGSIGRTDLPMGNHETLIKSIKTKLLTLPKETKVYSGHGGITNIATEIASNPFLV